MTKQKFYAGGVFACLTAVVAAWAGFTTESARAQAVLSCDGRATFPVFRAVQADDAVPSIETNNVARTTLAFGAHGADVTATFQAVIAESDADARTAGTWRDFDMGFGAFGLLDADGNDLGDDFPESGFDEVAVGDFATEDARHTASLAVATRAGRAIRAALRSGTPSVGGVALDAGHILRPASSNSDTFAYRLYRAETGGPLLAAHVDFYVPLGGSIIPEEFDLAGVGAGPRVHDGDQGRTCELTAADVADGLFFLDRDFVSTTVAAASNYGYTAPTCSSGVASANDLSCRAERGGGGTAAEKDSEYYKAVGLFGGVVALLALYDYAQGGDADAFSFSPDFGYAITESGYSYKYGGRVDFHKDAWSLYWTAGQRNANGEFGNFRYKSGVKYDGGFWRAAFSESAAGDAADYDFSLSADYTGGIWKVSPTYRFHSRLTDGGLESESGNALSLEGALRYHRWTISSSAGVRWRRAGDFGDDAKFSISAARRF